MALIDLNNSPRCQHIHFTGRPCKAPARRGRNFCVFHQAAHFDSGGCTLPVIEDLHSYQVAIIRILRALSEDIIDSKKATALLYGLQLVGSKLDRFVDEREHVENPIESLKDEVIARHRAENSMKRTFDGIPAADLRRILADLAHEQSEPSENIAIVPNPSPSPTVIPSEDEPISERAAFAREQCESESKNLHCSQPAESLNETAGSSTPMSQPRNTGAPAPSPLGMTADEAQGGIEDQKSKIENAVPCPASRDPRPRCLTQTQRVSPQAHPRKPATSDQRPATKLPPAVSLSPARV